MTTEKQIKANQANSKKSTGAVTPEGKAVVATNALKHGIFSSRLILADENPEESQDLRGSIQVDSAMKADRLGLSKVGDALEKSVSRSYGQALHRGKERARESANFLIKALLRILPKLGV